MLHVHLRCVRFSVTAARELLARGGVDPGQVALAESSIGGFGQLASDFAALGASIRGEAQSSQETKRRAATVVARDLAAYDAIWATLSRDGDFVAQLADVEAALGGEREDPLAAPAAPGSALARALGKLRRARALAGTAKPRQYVDDLAVLFAQAAALNGHFQDLVAARVAVAGGGGEAPPEEFLDVGRVLEPREARGEHRGRRVAVGAVRRLVGRGRGRRVGRLEEPAARELDLGPEAARDVAAGRQRERARRAVEQRQGRRLVAAVERTQGPLVEAHGRAGRVRGRRAAFLAHGWRRGCRAASGCARKAG